MPRIAIFSANYLPNTGGVERYTYNLAKTLASDGFEVTIVTSNVFKLQEKEILQEKITIYRLSCINLVKGRFPLTRFFSKNFRKLNKELNSFYYDLVIVNTRFYFHSLYGAHFGKKHSKKVICIEHGSGHLTLGNPIMDFCIRIFEHSITAVIKHSVKDFYGVSIKCTEWLKHFKINAKGVFYNAVDINEIQNIKNNEKPFNLADFSLSKESKIITFTGRLIKEKGILTLVKATLLLNTKYNRPDIHLFVAGDGPLFNELRSLRNENIHILGKLPFTKIVPLLYASNIFCLPSCSEGFPTSILEAVACKKPYVIVTPVAGSHEILLDSSYGTILSKCIVNEEELANAILSVVDNKDKIETATQQAFNHLEQNFTWNKTAKKMERLNLTLKYCA